MAKIWSKTILAWSAAQTQSQNRLYIDSAAQNLIPRLAARLDSTRLPADDVADGSQCADMSADWSLTWHADCAWWCHTYIMLTSSWHAYCACWCHYYIMMTSSLSGSVAWVGSTGIWVGSAHPNEEDAWHTWGTSERVGHHLIGAWGRVRPCPTSFLPVASSLPPLHSGMVKTQFWKLSFLSKNRTPS
jgi:hypothetical protein